MVLYKIVFQNDKGIVNKDDILFHRIDKSFIDNLKVEIYRAKRFNLPLSLVDMQLSSDLAKKDLELKMVSYIKKTIRPTDSLTTLNYNRYLIFFAHTDKEQSKQFVNRIMHSIEALIDIYKIEVIFNIIEFDNETTPEELIKKVLNI